MVVAAVGVEETAAAAAGENNTGTDPNRMKIKRVPATSGFNRPFNIPQGFLTDYISILPIAP
jgi:hypothetical protein